MLKAFNAFQLVTLFAAGPFIINYLSNAEFVGHGIAFWIGIVAYAIGYVSMIVAVHESV